MSPEDLKWARLPEANLTGALLRYANLAYAQLWYAHPRRRTALAR
jgi:uncharacterized protein YjbI with pentapeptide repeats